MIIGQLYGKEGIFSVKGSIIKENVMRKYLVLIVAMLLVNGFVFAEDMKPGDMPSKSDAAAMKKEHMPKDHIMMKDGKMMIMKDGKSMALDADMTMPNGNIVSTDGTVTMKDGAKMMMKDGDRMDMGGNMMAKKPMMKDHIMMKDGKMMMMKNGKTTAMDTDMTMPNGNMVMKDGTIMMKDGSKVMMKDGDRMDMNGDMMKSKMKKGM
jgi:uncharacterized Zn-binding protein involved in type VI secretion